MMKTCLRNIAKMESPGFEPGAFRMQSERDTATPRSLCLNEPFLCLGQVPLLAHYIKGDRVRLIFISGLRGEI